MIKRYWTNWSEENVNEYQHGALCCFADAQAAVKEFLAASGNDMCHENRHKLAEAFGLQDAIVAPPDDRLEFFMECHNYACSIYGQKDLPSMVNAWLKTLPTDKEREEALGGIAEGICYYCGAETDHCYCTRDD